MNTNISSNKNNPVNIDRFVQIAIVIAMFYWSFAIIRPFLGFFTWSCILAVALYPLYKRLNHLLGCRPLLASCVFTVFNVFILVGLLAVLTNNLVSTLTDHIDALRSGQLTIPSPPDSVSSWPIIGGQLHTLWSSAASNLSALVTQYAKWFANAGTFILTKFASSSVDFLIFIFSLIFSGYLQFHDKKIFSIANQFAEKIFPKHGSILINMIGKTIHNVSVGVIGIATLQTLLFGLMIFMAGVPGAGLLSLLALFLGIAQISLILLIIPVIFWVVATKTAASALIFSVLIILSGLVDNILKPFVLGRGLETPMLVIFIGVIGGLLLQGLIGVFIGPVVLAVFYELVKHWLS